MAMEPKHFAEYVTRHQRRIFGFILTLVPNAADADDIFQETCLTLWRKADTFDPSGDFVRWACGVAFNVVRNARVKQLRGRVVFSDETVRMLLDERVSRREELDGQNQVLGDCLQALPAPHRNLLELCYCGEHSIEAISRKLHRQPNAVYQQLHRIRRALLKCIEERRRVERFS